MKIKEIMHPIDSKERVIDGINSDEDLYFLKKELVSITGNKIDVTNDNNVKIGEISSKLIKYIFDSYSKKLIVNMLDILSVGIVAIDPSGMIFYANEAYAALVELPLYKIIGEKISKIVPDSAILSVLKTREILVIENRNLPSIGKHVSGTIYPIFLDDEFRGAVSTFIGTGKTENIIKKANAETQFFRELLKTHEVIKEQEIIGQSPSYLKVLEKATILSETDATILIRGDNGVGKEVMAKFIHQKSSRSDRPFISVNCAAIPENLIESELFGYEEGSFTGAKSAGKLGKFEIVNGGTLFLDEIGDMPLIMQGKLLRAIQEKEIEKIGSTQKINVDARIITATNQPLEKMMERKEFRADLYFRLSTITLMIPPLKDRKEDIVLFINYFLNKYNDKYKKNAAIAHELIPYLYSYQWPGNVRELQSFIEYAVILSENNNIGIDMFKDYFGNIEEENTKPTYMDYEEYMSTPQKMDDVIASAEKTAIINTLKYTNNNRTKAMEILGLSRRTFYRKINEYSIK